MPDAFVAAEPNGQIGTDADADDSQQGAELQAGAESLAQNVTGLGQFVGTDTMCHLHVEALAES